MKNKIIMLLMMMMTCFTSLPAMTDMFVGDKLYIDDDEFSAKTQGDAFHIHIGHNMWLVTHSVHRDSRGLFAYESSLSRIGDGINMSYEKQWKCPYCHGYWPVGKPCGDKDCPSKYK